MNKFKGTPGPWDRTIQLPDSTRLTIFTKAPHWSYLGPQQIGEVFDDKRAEWKSTAKANAALIAQAPAMLEALTAIDGALRMKFSGGDVLDENSPIRDSIMDILAALRAAGAIE